MLMYIGTYVHSGIGQGALLRMEKEPGSPRNVMHRVIRVIGVKELKE